MIETSESKVQAALGQIKERLPDDLPNKRATSVSNTEQIAVCAYLTDVEGNYDYFDRYKKMYLFDRYLKTTLTGMYLNYEYIDRYLDISHVLGWADEKKTKLKFKRDDAMFVFGGDSQDKGIGDIRFVRLLLALKKDYPERVEFIIGNRDANKLRLSTELSEKAIRDPQVLIDKSFPYWDIEDKRFTPQMFLDQNKAENGGSENNAANRLRWILDKNMGAPGAFERRRHELSILRAVDKMDVSDEDVVASYRDEVDPAKPPGLKWEAVGQLRPTQGQEIENEALAAQFQEQHLEFTKEEWNSFKVDAIQISYESFVKSGDTYYKPADKGGDGPTMIAEGLSKNKSLTHLNLSCNGIGAGGGIALARALCQNSTLAELHLGGEHFPAAPFPGKFKMGNTIGSRG